MKIDIVSSMPHYYRHVKPVFDALHPSLQGDPNPGRGFPDPGNVALVAAWSDLDPLRQNHEYFYVEHGAGQAYAGDVKSALQPGYSGSGGYRHHGCLGFICPNQTVADRWTTAPAIAVGCPKLDKYFCPPVIGRDNPPRTNICIAFHWDGPICPETRSAWTWYAPRLQEIRLSLERQGFTVHGHAHPKWNGALASPMRDAGLLYHEDEESMFAVCGSLAMDNSSLMYEFAALGRPVIALNAPWYRRDVHHGLRFWSDVPGPQVDTPEQLLEVSMPAALFGAHGLMLSASRHAYAHMADSAPRAARFIESRLRELGRL